MSYRERRSSSGQSRGRLVPSCVIINQLAARKVEPAEMISGVEGLSRSSRLCGLRELGAKINSSYSYTCIISAWNEIKYSLHIQLLFCLQRIHQMSHSDQFPFIAFLSTLLFCRFSCWCENHSIPFWVSCKNIVTKLRHRHRAHSPISLIN